jgi:hypothetical protein
MRRSHTVPSSVSWRGQAIPCAHADNSIPKPPSFIVHSRTLLGRIEPQHPLYSTPRLVHCRPAPVVCHRRVAFAKARFVIGGGTDIARLCRNCARLRAVFAKICRLTILADFAVSVREGDGEALVWIGCWLRRLNFVCAEARLPR